MAFEGRPGFQIQDESLESLRIAYESLRRATVGERERMGELVSRAEAALRQAEEELGQARAEQAAAVQRADQADRRFREVIESRSWRLTSAARWLGCRLRRG